MNTNSKKVLVTCATGFLGSKLCVYLKNKGFSVIATGRNQNKGEELKSNGFEFIQADLAKDKLEDKFQDIDFVVHCAALSSPWGKYSDFYEANILATKNIAELCISNKIRLVHISSPSIYFEFKDKFDIKEDEDSRPSKKINYYAETKFLAEKLLDEYYKKGLNVITLRPRAIFGAGDTTIIPRLLRANNTKFIPIIGNGDIKIDITHVDNVCEAVYLALSCKDKFSGNKYNVTNDEPIQLIDFLREIITNSGYLFNAKKLPFVAVYFYAYFLEFIHKYILSYKEPAITRYSIGVLAFSQTLNIDSIKRDLGYKPVKSIEQGKLEILEWLKSEKF